MLHRPLQRLMRILRQRGKALHHLRQGHRIKHPGVIHDQTAAFARPAGAGADAGKPRTSADLNELGSTIAWS